MQVCWVLTDAYTRITQAPTKAQNITIPLESSLVPCLSSFPFARGSHCSSREIPEPNHRFVLPVLEDHIKGIIQDAVFQVKLFFLRTPLGFIHTITWIYSSVLRTAKSVSYSVVSDSLRPHGLFPARLLCPWDFPSKNTGLGCHSLLQGIFSIQPLNPGLLNCRQILYCLSHKGRPTIY